MLDIKRIKSSIKHLLSTYYGATTAKCWVHSQSTLPLSPKALASVPNHRESY